MARQKTASLIRQALMSLAIAATGLLAACGPGQGSSATTVVLTGPPDKVDALILRHKLLGSPVQAQMEKLGDGRERARFHLSKRLPMGEVIALGKDAARDDVSFEFASGTQWGSGDPQSQAAPPGGDPATRPPARSGGPVV